MTQPVTTFRVAVEALRVRIDHNTPSKLDPKVKSSNISPGINRNNCQGERRELRETDHKQVDDEQEDMHARRKVEKNAVATGLKKKKKTGGWKSTGRKARAA